MILFSKFKNYLLLKKYKKNNIIKSNVTISNDLILGKNCFIDNNTIISNNVKIANGVHIGSNVFLSNITIGENSFIESGVICTGYGNGKITIGKESYIGIYNILDWSDNIHIGDFVHIAGPSTGLWTHTSAKMCYFGIPLKEKNFKYRPTKAIKIEDNVYIGGNCTIYQGQQFTIIP